MDSETTETEYKITCPYCKQENSYMLKIEIDIDERPGFKEKIYNDELNKFVCHNCLYTCEMYYDFILINPERKYVILFSKNKEFLKEWTEIYKREEYNKEYNEDLNYRKRPLGVSVWKTLKKKIDRNEKVAFKAEVRMLEKLAEKDPIEFYEYVCRNMYLYDHSEVAFNIDRLLNKYNILDLLLNKKYEEIDSILKSYKPMVALGKLFEYLGKANSEINEAKNTFEFNEEKIFNDNKAILIDTSKCRKNLILRSKKNMRSNYEEKFKERIDNIYFDFRVYLGRNSKDYIEFCAVDSEDDMERIKEIDDFYWINIFEDTFEFFEYIFKEAYNDDKKYDIYSFMYFDKENLEYLMNELDDFFNAMNYYPTFDVFYSVCKRIYGERRADIIAEEYCEFWEELRKGLQLVCLQLQEFFSLCIKNNKTVWMQKI